MRIMHQLCMVLMLSDASAVPLHDIRRLPFFLQEVEFIKSLLVYHGPIPRPTKHAPLAAFQRNLVPAHSEDNIIAEESSSFRHLLHGCAADIPAPRLWEQEDPELAHAVQWVAERKESCLRVRRSVCLWPSPKRCAVPMGQHMHWERKTCI